ncbi:methionine ABC transporter ATP-binding protein [Treponema sp.]|uniref:methionine ABC transporter ATP-binding protein n=1 Tax=Treponema sp. TaxID=166 RepID=UPI003F114A4E
MQIKLDNLKKTYSGPSGIVTAVNGISLEIPEKNIFGIIGRSGAGKSSLVRLISLLEKPDEGQVFYGDKRVDNLTNHELILRRRKIGMIFQNFNLFTSRSAARNIAYPLEICGASSSFIKSRVEEMLALVGLEDKADSPVSALSGGQKQRIAIARALATDPDVLFCDEATSALDPQTTISILNLIRDIQKKIGLTVVMITHQMEVVRDACEQVAVVDAGRIVEQGKVKDIFNCPKSEVTREFVRGMSWNSKSRLVRWSDEGGQFVLHFRGEKTGNPVMSTLAKKFDVEFNIRAGGIQHIESEDFGTMLVDFSGSKTEIQKALSFLKEQGIIVEDISQS